MKILGLLFLFFGTSCSLTLAQNFKEVERALKQINPSDIKRHTITLSSDAFEGRPTGSKAEKKTLDYIVNQLKEAKVASANPDGSYLQKVELVDTRIAADIQLKKGSKLVTLDIPLHAFVTPRSSIQDQEVDAKQILFMGNEKHLSKLPDLTGKFILYRPTSVSLVRPTLDSLQIKGAKGVLIIHHINFEVAFDVLRENMWHHSFRLASQSAYENPSLLNITVSEAKAREILELAGHSYPREVEKIANNTFVPLEWEIDIHCKFDRALKPSSTFNIIAKIDGIDPVLKAEYVVYTAHWDHFGTGPSVQKDSIYNGAIDNAGGVATLLSMAKAYKKIRPKRSILFIFTTAEEIGHLGAKSYLEKPIVPLKNTVANINLDWFWPYGKTKDVVVFGMGYNTIEDVALQVAQQQGRYLRKDPWPEKNFYFGSDHYPFAVKGIPALFTGQGTDLVTKGMDYGQKLFDDYFSNHYHQPSDEVELTWDWEGAALDAKYYFMVGYFVAQQKERPAWKDSCPYPEFKAKWKELQKE